MSNNMLDRQNEHVYHFKIRNAQDSNLALCEKPSAEIALKFISKY